MTLPTSSQTTQTSPAKNAELGIQLKPVTKASSTQASALDPPSAQTSPTSMSSKESEATDTRPRMMYKNKIIPIHEDAQYLIPRIAYYQPIPLADRFMLKPVEFKSEATSYMRESRSAAVAKKCIMRTIMCCLLPLYRAFSTYHNASSTMEQPEYENLCNPFRDSATHQKLKNKFFIKYLAKAQQAIQWEKWKWTPGTEGSPTSTEWWRITQTKLQITNPSYKFAINQYRQTADWRSEPSTIRFNYHQMRKTWNRSPNRSNIWFHHQRNCRSCHAWNCWTSQPLPSPQSKTTRSLLNLQLQQCKSNKWSWWSMVKRQFQHP